MEIDWKRIQQAFVAPFDPAEHKQRPGRGGKSYTYVDARAVQDRLDEVVGLANWEVRFEIADVEHSAVKCILTVHGITREEYGYPNNGDDSDEPLKQAASDGLKRAACQFGIGRYLWQLGPGQRPQNQPQQRPTGGHLLDEAVKLGGVPQTFTERVLALPTNGNGQSENRPILPASEAQLRAIFTIARQKQSMDEAEIEAKCKTLYGVGPAALSRKQASDLIGTLQGQGA